MNIYFLIPLISTLSGCLIALLLKSAFLKRAPGLLRKLSQQLATSLFSSVDLPSVVGAKNNFEQIRPLVEERIDDFLRHKLGTEMPMIGMFIGDKTILQLKGIFMKELEEIFPLVMEKYLSGISTGFNPKAFIEKKISSLSRQDVRMLLYGSTGGWLRMIPLSGAIAGLTIGLLQVIIIWLAS